jgi:hypothetical protein
MHRQTLCENCGIAIEWQPTIVGGKTYCCVGCAHGGPCECDYDNLPQADDVNPMVPHTEFRLAERSATSET